VAQRPRAVEALVRSQPGRSVDPDVWAGRSVLVTGHTGFKGSWLARWLTLLGAQVHGIALDPPTDPALFVQGRVADVLASDLRIDVRGAAPLTDAVQHIAPSVVLHLAAQPLVRDGYRDPATTFATNTLGTVHLLEACRRTPGIDAVVVVTTDKVYAPRQAPHTEDDLLGAEDPYAWSKVMAEQAVDAYRRLPAIDDLAAWSIPMATARAGNVVGGGDWSSERLVPDCVRAFGEGRPVTLRYPEAVRPWQHVLDPLHGYLLLAEELLTSGSAEVRAAGAYNFGPPPSDDATVEQVARGLAERFGAGASVVSAPEADQPHENPHLRLDSARAREDLGWEPRWGLEATLDATADWYRRVLAGADGAGVIDEQIHAFHGGA